MTEIRPVEPGDAAEIAAIYDYYVLGTVASFEEEPVDAGVLLKRIDKVLGAGLPWLVVCESGRVRGYAYAAPWRERTAYRYSVETTIYLEPEAAGRGTGETLYRALLEQLERARVRAAVAGITLPNPASVRLHEKLGFTKVAEFPEIGYKFHRWLAVGYWQKQFAYSPSPGE